MFDRASPILDSARTAPARAQRYHGLDGLRGVAACVVLICHTFLVLPSLALAYFAPAEIPRGSLAWWATFSPLHTLWAGTEAVYLFFVLSGFVLTLPFLDGGRWAGYYPKRMLRLYLPTWGAFALVLFWLAVVPRLFPPEASLWLQTHPPELSPDSVTRHLFLLPEGPMNGNGVLWTLRFEVLFSLLLPVMFFVGLHLPKLNLIKVAGLFAAMVAFSTTGYTLRFLLPMFGLGVLMACERKRLALLASRIQNLTFSSWVWTALSLLALSLIANGWTILGLTSDPRIIFYMQRTTGALTTAGACLALFLAAEGPWRAFLEKPALRWLGKRSFSLYLVHEPIAVSVGVLLGADPELWMAFGIAVPFSLLVAEIFYRLIERPSQRFARFVGARVDAVTAGLIDVPQVERVLVPD